MSADKELRMKKVWLITGAGSGIGVETVKAALKAGHRVVATGRDIDKLQVALNEVANDNLAIVSLDVTDAAQIKAAVATAVERFGRIDVLVNNAGYCLMGNFEELSTQSIEQQMATNFFGVMHVMRAVLPVMRQQRSGHIFNISSVAGVVGFKNCAAYSASKFALEGMSLSVAHEVAQFGIKLTVVEPGFFRTSLLSQSNARYASTSIQDYAHEASPEVMMSGYHGVQPGSPEKLGNVLVALSEMETPPQIFVAGSDALAMITPEVEKRLQAIHAHEEMSRSTDFSV